MISNFLLKVRSPKDIMIAGQSLIAARWIAFLGQTFAILIAHFALGFDFPVIPCLFFVILSGIVNNYATIKDHHKNISSTKALAYLSYDILQLTVLLFLTGGLTNPFFVILVAPVLVGASLLPKIQMLLLLLLGLTCSLYISLFHFQLGWPQTKISKEELYLIAEAIGLGITLVFTSYYSWQISEENRSMQKANFAARTALMKQKQLQALGGQAAAAVHELGSPLGTITIIAKELEHELGKNSDYSDDISILISQTERCRAILSQFGKTLRNDPTYMAEPLQITALLKTISEGFLMEKPEIRFTITTDPKAENITLPQSPELSHGLGVYIQNALQFAKSNVSVSVEFAKDLKITIHDDGIGFASHILSRLGDPYTSSRIDNGKNMGLGVFIAQTLLEETGAKISYGNRMSGGAQVIVVWSEQKIHAMLQTDIQNLGDSLSNDR